MSFGLFVIQVRLSGQGVLDGKKGGHAESAAVSSRGQAGERRIDKGSKGTCVCYSWPDPEVLTLLFAQTGC